MFFIIFHFNFVSCFINPELIIYITLISWNNVNLFTKIDDVEVSELDDDEDLEDELDLDDDSDEEDDLDDDFELDDDLDDDLDENDSSNVEELNNLF